MNNALARCSMQITNPHERRRGMPATNGGFFMLGRDLLHSQSYWRRVSRTCAHAADQYRRHRAATGHPTLGQLRMIEAAIRCEVACRDAAQAWRFAA